MAATSLSTSGASTPTSGSLKTFKARAIRRLQLAETSANFLLVGFSLDLPLFLRDDAPTCKTTSCKGRRTASLEPFPTAPLLSLFRLPRATWEIRYATNQGHFEHLITGGSPMKASKGVVLALLAALLLVCGSAS